MSEQQDQVSICNVGEAPCQLSIAPAFNGVGLVRLGPGERWERQDSRSVNEIKELHQGYTTSNPLASKRFTWTSSCMMLADRGNDPAPGYYDVRYADAEIERLTAQWSTETNAHLDTLEELNRLRAALEGLHFHHKMFEPDCRLCQEALRPEEK